jgi:tetratricopeptide (TPR) repeat protein
MDLANAYLRVGREQDAMAVLQTLLESRELQYGPRDERIFSILTRFGQMFNTAGQFQETIQFLAPYRERLEHASQDIGQAIRARMQTAVALSELGRYDESLKLVEALLSLATQHNCRDRWLLNEAAIVYRDASRYEQAMAVLEETLSQLQQDARPDGFALAYTNGALGMCRLAQGQDAESIPLLEQAVSWAETASQSPRVTFHWVGHLMSAYVRVGRDQDAVRLYDKTLAATRTTFGPEHPFALDLMRRYVEAFQEGGKSGEVLTVAEDMWQLTQKILPPDAVETLANKRVLGALYCDVRQFQPGVKLLEEVVQQHRQLQGPQHPATSRSIDCLATAYAQAGQLEQAVSLLEETLRNQRDTLGPEHRSTLASMIDLGRLYRLRERQADAESLLLEAQRGFARRGEAHPTPYDRARNRLAMSELVQLYETWNQPDKATAWKEKLAALTEEPKQDDGSK